MGNTDSLHEVWYRREVQIPAEWSGRNVLLHFQAVDYDAMVRIKGARGCYTRLTDIVPEENGFFDFHRRP